MAGLMNQKKEVDITAMYKALTFLGHRRIWLRIIPSNGLYMVTFKSRQLARFNHEHNTWRFLRNADLVDDYSQTSEPEGEWLTELHEKDDGELLTNLLIREGNIDLIRSYLESLDD